MANPIVHYIEAESRTAVIRDGDVDETKRYWSKGIKLQLYRMNNSRHLMFSTVTRVNNTVMNTGNSLKE